jgi:hypothetical protein
MEKSQTVVTGTTVTSGLKNERKRQRFKKSFVWMYFYLPTARVERQPAARWADYRPNWQ